MFDVKVKVYDKAKYEKGSVKVAEVTYKDVIGLAVNKISDAVIFSKGFDETDPYKEYVTMAFENGETATFRNSFVDCFKL